MSSLRSLPQEINAVATELCNLLESRTYTEGENTTYVCGKIKLSKELVQKVHENEVMVLDCGILKKVEEKLGRGIIGDWGIILATNGCVHLVALD